MTTLIASGTGFDGGFDGTFGLIGSEWHRRWHAIESELSLIDDGLFGATTIMVRLLFLSTIICLMLPMEELASLPLLWGRERIRESKRDEVSGSHTICGDDAQCQFGLVLSRDGWISHLHMKHGFAGS